MTSGYERLYELLKWMPEEWHEDIRYILQTPHGWILTAYHRPYFGFCAVHEPQPIQTSLLWSVRDLRMQPTPVCETDERLFPELPDAEWIHTDSSAVVTPNGVYPTLFDNGVESAVLLDGRPEDWYSLLTELLVHGIRSGPGWRTAFLPNGDLLQRAQFRGMELTLYTQRASMGRHMPSVMHPFRPLSNGYPSRGPASQWLQQLGYQPQYGIARMDIDLPTRCVQDVNDLPGLLRSIAYRVVYPALDGSIGAMVPAQPLSFPNPLYNVRAEWSSDLYRIRYWRQHPLSEWAAVYMAPVGALYVDTRPEPGVSISYAPFALELKDGSLLCYYLPANGYPGLVQECTRRSAG